MDERELIKFMVSLYSETFSGEGRGFIDSLKVFTVPAGNSYHNLAINSDRISLSILPWKSGLPDVSSLARMISRVSTEKQLMLKVKFDISEDVLERVVKFLEEDNNRSVGMFAYRNRLSNLPIVLVISLITPEGVEDTIDIEGRMVYGS